MPRKKKNTQQEIKITIEDAPLSAGFLVIKKANKFLILSSLGFFLFSLFVVDISVFAYKGPGPSQIAASDGIEESEGADALRGGETGSSTGYTGNLKGQLTKVKDRAKFSELSIGTIIANIIQVMLGMLGVVFVILIIYSGFSWMTSAGDPEKIKGAQGHLRNAVIGAAIVIGAQIITYWVLHNITTAALPPPPIKKQAPSATEDRGV